MTGVLSSQCLLITEGVGTKRIPRCHSSGQSCPGESGPIPRRAFRRALGMGPDEPGQLCTEKMAAWDSFSHP